MAPGAVVEDWSFMKMIVRVDLTALDRGQVAPGEVCEIAGQGPIPVADTWRMIDGDAFVAAVTTNGTEIDKVDPPRPQAHRPAEDRVGVVLRR